MSSRELEHLDELQIHEIELTSPRSRNYETTENQYEMLKYQMKIVKIYQIIMHIFLFSVFESFFFWFYIIYQEEKAFRNNFKELSMISNLICINANIDLDPLYEYMENESINYNNNVPLRFTFVLNGSLFSFIIILNVIMVWGKQNIKKINICILKQDFIVLIGLFLYEYLFFQNIIYNYKPKAAMDIQSVLFSQCI
jgi:hypothetical protein